MTRRIFLSVGEPSGDLHAANLVRALKQSQARVECFGFGGPNMAQAGCELVFPLVEKPIMGLAGALRAIPLVKTLFRDFERLATENPPDALVLIDYPGFNFRLARIARQFGIPVIYYIPPQIWAWGSWRIRRFQRDVDHILCSLPFEEAWYQSHGLSNVEYVGHPFFDDLQQNQSEVRQAQSLQEPQGRRNVLLLPGSRLWEAKNNAKALVDAAKKLLASFDGLNLHVAAFNDDIAQHLEQVARNADLTCQIHVQRTRALMASADLAIAVSGSVSLELLHYQVPSIMLYTVPWHWQTILRPIFLHTPHITLVNLIAGRRIYPEFTGSGDLSSAIAAEAASILNNNAKRLAIQKQLEWLNRTYATPGASLRAASSILKFLDSAPPGRAAA